MKTICLIGSSRFKNKFHEIGAKLEKEGNLVLMMSFFQHADNVSVSDEERKVLEEVDKFRIDKSDEVYVVNVKVGICPNCKLMWQMWKYPCCMKELKPIAYIGEDTKKELEYARKSGKTILSLNPLES